MWYFFFFFFLFLAKKAPGLVAGGESRSGCCKGFFLSETLLREPALRE